MAIANLTFGERGRWISAAWTARPLGAGQRWPVGPELRGAPMASGCWRLSRPPTSGSTTGALINLRTCQVISCRTSRATSSAGNHKAPFHSRGMGQRWAFCATISTKSLPLFGFAQRQSRCGNPKRKYSPSGARFSRWKGQGDGSSPITRQGFRLLKALRFAPTAIPTLVGAGYDSSCPPNRSPHPTDRPTPRPGRAAGAACCWSTAPSRRSNWWRAALPG